MFFLLFIMSSANFFSFDPQGTSFNYLATDFPTNVTVLQGTMSIRLADGERISNKAGVYNHHAFFMDITRPMLKSDLGVLNRGKDSFQTSLRMVTFNQQRTCQRLAAIDPASGLPCPGDRSRKAAFADPWLLNNFTESNSAEQGFAMLANRDLRRTPRFRPKSRDRLAHLATAMGQAALVIDGVS